MEAPVLHRLLLFFIIVGIAVSIYATLEVLDPALQSSCSVSPFFSCAAVDQSGHTTVGPIPDWSIGLGGFLLLLVLDIPLIRTYNPRLLDLVAFFSVVGVAVSVYFAYVELAIINHLCPVCLSAYIANALVLFVALLLIRMRTQALRAEREPDSKPSTA